MKPHLDEAARMVRLAERDLAAFAVLRLNPDVHHSIVCFHAQQAVEKCLKAILFARGRGFQRTHDLRHLGSLLADAGVVSPLTPDELDSLTPFAVTFRYDECQETAVDVAAVADLVERTASWARSHLRSSN